MVPIPPTFKILLVEDQPLVRKIHEKMLAEMGHSPDVAEDGQQAIAMAKSYPYGLILMDIGLPDITGIDASMQIRQTQSGKVVPIVALTAYALQEVEEKCLAAGMDRVLTKPVVPDTLQLLINSYVIKYHAQHPSITSNLEADLLPTFVKDA